ncbi:MAG: FAD:protein FMN transferase [Candidatus Microthrix sp.]|nr:FAD:protein FMN transferase [Candidatus Microthrix sp.]MBK9560592.1 FAD:protein FMN transferase [Candidatus Microthrix sp.]
MASSVVIITLDGPASAGRDARLRLVELEALWSRFAPGSDIDRLNRAAGAPVPVSRATITLLNTMVEAAKSTDGRFDPTMLPALIEAGYQASIDDADRITTLSPGPHRSCVGLEDVVIDADARTVTLPPDVAIDPGGIGKGLAADLVAEQLVLDGAAGALVSIGGDLAVAGESPQGHGWEVEVEDPHDPVHALAHLGVPCGGVATSSTVSRRWDVGKMSTHHVIDPRTGVASTTDLAAVTVVAPRAWLAEAHATGVLLGGSDHVLAYAHEHRLEALAVDTEGRVFATGGLDPTLIRPLRALTEEVC